MHIMNPVGGGCDLGLLRLLLALVVVITFIIIIVVCSVRSWSSHVELTHSTKKCSVFHLFASYLLQE